MEQVLFRIITILFSFFISFLYWISPNFALADNLIMINFNGIQDLYYEYDLIEFELNIKSSSTIEDALFYYCAVEIKIEGHWREVAPSIDANKTSKTVKLSKITTNQTQRLIWDRRIQKTLYPAINSGVFRFKIDFFKHPEMKSFGRFFSKEFKILPEHGIR